MSASDPHSLQQSKQLLENPYELVRKMKKVITHQRKQLEQYELIFDNYMKEKQVLLREKRLLQSARAELLTRIEALQYRSADEKTSYKNFQSLTLTKHPTNLLLPKNMMTRSSSKKLELMANRPYEKLDYSKSGVFGDSSTAANIKKIQENTQNIQKQYVPQPIRLSTKAKKQTSILNFRQTLSLDPSEKLQYKNGQNLMESFLVIGPDINMFKNKRGADKNKQEIVVSPACLYIYGKQYKERKTEFISEIAKRAFPQGCNLRKKKPSECKTEQLTDIIEYKPNPNLSEDYFIFTLKGDESLFKHTLEHPHLRSSMLYMCNSNYFLFVVCLRLPDFVHMRREKSYHTVEQQVWLSEKIYVMVTYYPYFRIHTSVLCRLHEIMSKVILKKVLIDNEDVSSWNLAKSVYSLEKNEEVHGILDYFSAKRPEYNQICYHSSNYFGTIPEPGPRSIYCTALACCPVFFSNFSYEEMLLMLTAVFCQKTLIFMSKTEAVATMSALFLTNLITPFQYSQPLLLNCDQNKVKTMVFEFPFAMICSIKKTDENIQNILELFAESNIMRSMENDAQYILIDVDSNSILYHHVLGKLFSQCVVSPGQEVKQAYLEVNCCESKSFSLPKVLLRENFKPNTKPKSELEKRKEEIKRTIKQYQEKLSTNQVKMPTFKCSQNHQKLLWLLASYIQQYTLNNPKDPDDCKLIRDRLENVSKKQQIEVAKSCLLEKYPARTNIITKFLQSQMYANYLDNFMQK